MSTTLSMWLGITFVILAITAVFLQAWLWGPKFWDEEAKRTRAPKLWLRVHALVGYSFLAIYVVMMWNMVPRLWEYQVELPARTVIHAVAAIVIGVLILTKIMILRFFRHFEEAMPTIGVSIMTCTVVLASLSVPFAIRAHDFGDAMQPENIERVKGILADIELGEDVDKETLTSEQSLGRGRDVLVQQCTACHDMRTILLKPRTGSSWHKVIRRMAEKPRVIGEAIEDSDIPFVTAYMIAITPDIQQSAKIRKEAAREHSERIDGLDDALLEDLDGEVPPEGDEPTETPEAGDTKADDTKAEDTKAEDTKAEDAKAVTPAPKPKKRAPRPLDKAKAKRVLQRRCTECHDLGEITGHGGDSARGWSRIVKRMIADEGAEVSRAEARLIARFLAAEYPK